MVPRQAGIVHVCIESSSEETMETIEEEEGEDGCAESAQAKVFMPGTALKEGEELVHDSSTYHMYHVVSNPSLFNRGEGERGVCERKRARWRVRGVHERERERWRVRGVL